MIVQGVIDGEVQGLSRDWASRNYKVARDEVLFDRILVREGHHGSMRIGVTPRRGGGASPAHYDRSSQESQAMPYGFALRARDRARRKRVVGERKCCRDTHCLPHNCEIGESESSMLRLTVPMLVGART